MIRDSRSLALGRFDSIRFTHPPRQRLSSPCRLWWMVLAVRLALLHQLTSVVSQWGRTPKTSCAVFARPWGQIFPVTGVAYGLAWGYHCDCGCGFGWPNVLHCYRWHYGCGCGFDCWRVNIDVVDGLCCDSNGDHRGGCGCGCGPLHYQLLSLFFFHDFWNHQTATFVVGRLSLQHLVI